LTRVPRKCVPNDLLLDDLIAKVRGETHNITGIDRLLMLGHNGNLLNIKYFLVSFLMILNIGTTLDCVMCYNCEQVIRPANNCHWSRSPLQTEVGCAW